MQHPVMGASELEFRKNFIGMAGEIAVSKEQQLDQPNHRRLASCAGGTTVRRTTFGLVGEWVGTFHNHVR